MAKYEEFIKKYEESADKIAFVRDRMPVILEDEKQPEAFEKVYKEIVDPWEYSDITLYKQFYISILQNIKEFISNKRVLDLGTGKGIIWHFQNDADVYPMSINGTEVSHTAVKMGMENINKPLNVHIEQINLGNPEEYVPYFKSLKIDVIYSCSFLYYLRAPRRVELFKNIINIKPSFIISSSTKWNTNDIIYKFPSVYGNSEYTKIKEFRIPNPHHKGSSYYTVVWGIN